MDRLHLKQRPMINVCFPPSGQEFAAGGLRQPAAGLFFGSVFICENPWLKCFYPGIVFRAGFETVNLGHVGYDYFRLGGVVLKLPQALQPFYDIRALGRLGRSNPFAVGGVVDAAVKLDGIRQFLDAFVSGHIIGFSFTLVIEFSASQ